MRCAVERLEGKLPRSSVCRPVNDIDFSSVRVSTTRVAALGADVLLVEDPCWICCWVAVNACSAAACRCRTSIASLSRLTILDSNSFAVALVCCRGSCCNQLAPLPCVKQAREEVSTRDQVIRRYKLQCPMNCMFKQTRRVLFWTKCRLLQRRCGTCKRVVTHWHITSLKLTMGLTEELILLKEGSVAGTSLDKWSEKLILRWDVSCPAVTSTATSTRAPFWSLIVSETQPRK